MGIQVIPSTTSHGAVRTARDCKVQWLGSDRPSLNKSNDWSSNEDGIIEEFIEGKDVRAGEVDWVELAKLLDVSRNRECLHGD